jgi:3',5'-cyclic AMP phosphodiesterase CpdA
MTSITVAHITDLHALTLRGARAWDFVSHKRLGGAVNLLLRRRNKHPVALFEALVDDLNRVRPDHVAVTGDLTNLSLDGEFAQAREVLDRLTLGPREVTVVPGNHDVYTRGVERARAFERALGPYALSDGAAEVEYPVLRRRGGLLLVGLSSARPSPVPFADGRVGAAQLARVEAALAGAVGSFRLVLVHHPPFDNRHALLRGLRDRRALQAVLARTGAELVLHGHEHRDVVSSLPGPAQPVPVLGTGSGTYDDPRPERRARYRLLRITGTTFSVETRVHDPASGRFIAAA